MCGRNSKTGARNILLLLVLLLLASPCYSRASWGALSNLIRDTPTEQQLVLLEESQTSLMDLEQEIQETQEIIQQESSQNKSMTVSSEEREESLKKLEELLSEYEKESINYEKLTDDVLTSLVELETQLKNLKESEAISEAEYQANRTTLQDLVVANANQADRLAALESEAGTKFYNKLYGVVGFDKGSVAYGVGTSLGVRIGDSFMVEAGADYMLGSFAQPIYPFSVDNLRITAGFGWMF